MALFHGQETSMGRQPTRRPAVVSRRQAAPQQLAAYEISVPRPRDVSAYLRQHPDLADVVPALCAEARREFAPPTELSLEVYRDPEIDDVYLTLYVRPATYETDLLDRIHRVTEAHAKDLARRSGHVLVTTDFRAPRTPNGV
jgi:hypothetical protein